MIIIRNTYVHEEQVHNFVSAYAPPDAGNGSDAINIKADNLSEQNVNKQDYAAYALNESIVDAQRNINEDISAWIRIPNTYIDYPVVHYGDNIFYLDHDILRQKAAAGSLFIDSRNRAGFTDFNTVIYGHNMKNGTMFGELNNFSDINFFANNPTGQLFLPDRTYTLEIFAYLRIKQDDRIIYGTISGVNLTEYIKYIKINATNYRDIQLSDNDKIVPLSTCTNDYADSRMVVLAKLKPMDN